MSNIDTQIKAFNPDAVIASLKRDEIKAMANMDRQQAKFCIGQYYALQNTRIRLNAQVGAIERSREKQAQEGTAVSDLPPNSNLVGYLGNSFETLEAQIKRVMDAWTMEHPIGRWIRSQKGFGPVLTAGFLAHLDVTKTQTAGGFWRYAGLDPTVTWNKGEKRPWNADLKKLCYLAGECLVKASMRKGVLVEDCYYGVMLRKRKDFEIVRDLSGENAPVAKQILRVKNFGAETDARRHLESGHLPPAQLHARARRWAMKLFLSHLHDVMRMYEIGAKPAEPYAIAHLGHVHKHNIPGDWLSFLTREEMQGMAERTANLSVIPMNKNFKPAENDEVLGLADLPEDEDE